MALLQAEIERIRDECGYNVLTVGAEPYISYVAVFDQVIAQYLQAGATTTSSTAVTAVTPPTVSSPVTLVLASATGFSSGARIVIDVDARQETATIENLSGSSATVLLSLAHTGTYPVTVDGGETIIRELLKRIREVKEALATRGLKLAGIKRADEVEFFQGMWGRSSYLSDYERMLAFWRQELCDALGVQNLRALRRGAMSGSTPVLY